MTETATAQQPAQVRRDVLTRFTPESSRLANDKRRAMLRPGPGNGLQRPGNGLERALPVTGNSDPAFTAACLRTVREQLRRVYALLSKELDPSKLDKLCSASAKLEEQERRLSDRSLPPVRRAQDQAPAKTRGSSLFADGLDEG